MPRYLLFVGLAKPLTVALALTACGPTKTADPIPVYIACPTVEPPAIPELPPRPDDLRELEADRYKIEGLWSGVELEQDEYRFRWADCIEDVKEKNE